MRPALALGAPLRRLHRTGGGRSTPFADRRPRGPPLPHPCPVPQRPRLGADVGVGGVRPDDPDSAPRRRSSSSWLATPERRFAGAETPVEALAASLAAGRVSTRRSSPTCWPANPTPSLAELAAAGLIYRAHDDPDGGNRPPPTCPVTSASRLAAVRPSPPSTPATSPTWPRWRRCCRSGCPPRRSRPGSAPCGSRPATSTSSSSTCSAPTTGACRARPDRRALGGHRPVLHRLVGGGHRSVGHPQASAYDLVARRAEPDPDRRLPHRPRTGRGSSWKPRRWPPTTNAPRCARSSPTWVWADPDRAARLEQIYNERFNSTVLPTWDGAHLDHLPGLSAAFDPHRHQRDAVWRIMGSTGNVLLGHRVGAGKTAAMVIAGQAAAPRRADHQTVVRRSQSHARPVRRRARPAVPDGQRAGRLPRRPVRPGPHGRSSPAAPPALGRRGDDPLDVRADPCRAGAPNGPTSRARSDGSSPPPKPPARPVLRPRRSSRSRRRPRRGTPASPSCSTPPATPATSASSSSASTTCSSTRPTPTKGCRSSRRCRCPAPSRSGPPTW